MPRNPQCTFTTGHLQRLNGFLPGIHAMHSSVKLVNSDGISTKFVPTTKNGLDYISVEIITPDSDPEKILPTACLARSLSAQLIHQKCGHYFQNRIAELAKKKLIDGLPSKIPALQTPCPFCHATKSVHHPRRPPADYTLLKPGQQLHMDWCFVGEPSIRGHLAILCIKCANTRKAWCFHSPNKRSPLDIIKFFILFLAKEGIFILQIRVDEDGSLAQSADFCMLLHTFNITLQTTGSYSSDLNGNVEIFNKILKPGSGALLANAGLPIPYWCYVSVHFCNLHNFLSYNHDKSKTAYEAWYGQKPNWKNFRVFGCDVYVLKETGSKNTLTKATCHKYLGWGSSTSLIHYLDSDTGNIKRARHVYFDDFSSATPYGKLSPGGLLLRNEISPPSTHDIHKSTPIEKVEKDNSEHVTNNQETTPTDTQSPNFSSDILNFHLQPDPAPFPENRTFEYTVDLSNRRSHPFGIFIQ